MKIALWIVGLAAATVVLLGIIVVGPYVYRFVANGDRTIAERVSVTNEWSELTIEPPVKPSQSHQGINLEIDGFKFDRNGNSMGINLPDGTVILPQIELYDENGNAWKLEHVGFALGGKNDQIEFWPTTQLPNWRTYPKMRIRSDVPFTCRRIEWIDYNKP